MEVLVEMNAFHIEGRYPESLAKPPTKEEALNYMIPGEGLFRTDISAGTGDAGDASFGAQEIRVRRDPAGHGKPRHAKAGSRSWIAGGMPLGQDEKTLSIHGREPGTRRVLEGGSVESRSRKQKLAMWGVTLYISL
jgi:hypothetical protein